MYKLMLQLIRWETLLQAMVMCLVRTVNAAAEPKSNLESIIMKRMENPEIINVAYNSTRKAVLTEKLFYHFKKLKTQVQFPVQVLAAHYSESADRQLWKIERTSGHGVWETKRRTDVIIMWRETNGSVLPVTYASDEVSEYYVAKNYWEFRLNYGEVSKYSPRLQWGLMDKPLRMEQFLDVQFHKYNLHACRKRCFMDGFVFGNDSDSPKCPQIRCGRPIEKKLSWAISIPISIGSSERQVFCFSNGKTVDAGQTKTRYSLYPLLANTVLNGVHKQKAGTHDPEIAAKHQRGSWMHYIRRRLPEAKLPDLGAPGCYIGPQGALKRLSRWQEMQVCAVLGHFDCVRNQENDIFIDFLLKNDWNDDHYRFETRTNPLVRVSQAVRGRMHRHFDALTKPSKQ